MLERLDRDLLGHILSLLCPFGIWRAARVSKILSELARDDTVWEASSRRDVFAQWLEKNVGLKGTVAQPCCGWRRALGSLPSRQLAGWCEASTPNGGPSGRAGHRGVLLGDTLVIFGGEG